jgi:two-component system CheB/CheR fusion protein
MSDKDARTRSDGGDKDAGRRPTARGARRKPAATPRARAARPSSGRTEPEPSHPFPIVGVGASAGGLEAFTELLSHVPPDTGMAFVLIQHLAPKHHTILPEILSRHTVMPVVLAENDLEVKPNSVYVIAPDTDMTIFHGRLNLMERTSVRGAHLPVDHFLRSLAADQGARGIGVILSGSASDGALGLAAVKAEGGITFAQDPQTARYEGMPSAAIAAGGADFVLDPASIAAELADLGKHPYLQHSPSAGRAAALSKLDEKKGEPLAKIFVILRSAYGVDFANYRVSTVQRRIERRLAVLRMDSLEEYVGYLREHHDEVEHLYHDILIMVTEFFREPETFAVIADTILPRIIETKRDDDTIRVWVPGCATGEEPYSIALCMVKALKIAGRTCPVKIFATDISARDIEAARSGVYAENRLQAMPDEFRAFFAASDGGYKIGKTIRDMCVFARHDVTSDPPFSQIDMVSCRNLLIYLRQQTQKRIMSVFHYALRPGGYLMLGTSESIGTAGDLFEPVDKKAKLFVRKSVPDRLPEDFTYQPSRALQLGRAHEPELIVSSRRFDPQRAAEDILLSEFTPPGVVINGRFEIAQFHGGTDLYLEHTSGRASLNLLEMAREGLAADIREIVAEAQQHGQPKPRGPLRFLVDDVVHEVTLHAVPLHAPQGAEYFLVLFEPAKRTDAGLLPEDGRALAGADARLRARNEITALRRERTTDHEHMQALVQDKEAALEELRAANEEIQSSNEELQSINEELETAKEELQSTNEELRTVNEELENRNLELSRANDDLNNLLRAVSVPTIMVGRDLRVRRFTPGAERVMNLLPSDIGRPITDIAPRLVDLTDLEVMLRDVVENIVVRERDVQDEHGHWHSMRIRPYQTEENRIEGAVIALVDIDEIRTTLAEVTEASRFSEAINSMMAELRAEAEVERVIPSVLRGAAETMGSDTAILLRQTDQGAWRVAFGAGLPASSLGKVIPDKELPQAVMAAATRAPVAVRAGANDILKPALKGMTARAMVVVPLFVHNAVAGVLAFTWSEAQDEAGEGFVDFAGKTAFLVSMALDEASAKESK